MKNRIPFLLLLLPILMVAQPKHTKEFSIGLNSVEPFYPAYGSLLLSNDGSSILGTNNNNSFSFGVLGKYFIAENSALRLKISLTLKDINNRQNVGDATSPGHGYINIRNKQQYLKFSPGYQWGIVSKRISFFGGLELPITTISEFEYTDKTYIVTNSEATDQRTRITQPGGFAIGLGFFLGSNFYISKHIGVGFEINSAFQHSNVGGGVSSVTVNYTNGDTIISETEGLKTKETKFTNLQGSLNVIFKI
ncbi:hypothetical protein [Flavobacterium phycosphaerae]|uniref:hypothetical protein n=1 Tax=Flavobacterium phycosphaerae TaxID=2697515 RepID=UPI001389AD7F|nr:hypothetical protein [Flavobacterium phycosphaerae]